VTVYVIAKLNITDPETYATYGEGFMEIFMRFGGKLLAVDENAEVIEGSWPYTRTVLLEFPDKAGMQAWYNSYDYQKLVKHRFAAATADIAMIEAFPAPAN
jgi:uncharacterized protein (DUF1330 family)